MGENSIQEKKSEIFPQFSHEILPRIFLTFSLRGRTEFCNLAHNLVNSFKSST